MFPLRLALASLVHVSASDWIGDAAGLVVRTMQPFAAVNGCALSLIDVALNNQMALVDMFLATGKNLPYDAGQYDTCKALKDSWNVSGRFFLVSMNAYMAETTIPMEIGVCLPAACTNADLLNSDMFFNTMWTTFFNTSFPVIVMTNSDALPQPPNTCRHPNPSNMEENVEPWGPRACCGTAILLILVVAVITATYIGEVLRANQPLLSGAPRSSSGEAPLLAEQRSLPPQSVPPFIRKVGSLNTVKAFDLFGPNGSWTSIWKAETKRDTDCLNGMRVIAMFSVILSHTVLVGGANSGYSDVVDIEANPFNRAAAETDPRFLMLFSGQMGVDTFFFCSGFLLSYLGMTRPTPLMPGIVLRYLRLTPSVAFMIMIYSTIAPFVSEGPFASRVQESILRKCNTGWWVPLVYSQWIYPWDGGEICAGWLWYLGNDILFFVICLGLLSIWKMNRRLSALITMAITGASIFISMYLVYEKNLGMYIFTQHKAYEEWLYERPWHRITVFILGFAVPLLLAAPKAAIAQGRRWRITKADVPRTRAANFIVYVSTFLAYVLMALVLFLPGTDLTGRNGRKPMTWTQTQNALYITFARPLWALGNLVIVMGCYFGYLPWTNIFLGHSFFNPLQKLTLGAYLFHPVIIKIASGNANGYYFFNYTDIFTHALCYIMVSYSVSAVSWCLVEKPFADLVDLLMPTKKKNTVAAGKGGSLPSITSSNVPIRAPGVAAS